MAGWSAAESVTGIADVLNLATIGSTSLATSSDIVTDGLTQLGMSANQAGNFVDMMAAAITGSNTNVEMMGETLKYAGSIAGTLGIDMADLSVAIGLMADSGIKASNSGTALRTLMTNLSAPTETVAGAMEEYGISLVTASDGSVDLNATLIGLRERLKGLPLTEQAEAAKALAGKTGMGGLLAIVNATDERYQELTDSINNSTQSVAYWNENCAITGKVGEEATTSIEMMKEAYQGSEAAAASLNLTTQDLALAVQVLGADSDVTSQSVNNLLNVFSTMRAPTEAQAETMKELGLTYREIDDDLFGYNKTCATVDSSITGLTMAQKEQIKAQLNTSMTLEEANNVLSKYDLTAKSASTGQIDMIANLEQLRAKFGNTTDEYVRNTLAQLGLGSAYEDVNEIIKMSDDEFKLYCENLELATGLAKKMADAMDVTTKNGLLSLSSAISDVAIEAFERFKGTLNGATGALNTFFKTWRNKGDGGEFNYSFDSFNLALEGLLETIRNTDIAGALGSAFDNALTFIQGGSLAKMLDIGSEIITKICDGIIQNKGKIEKGISSVISQISNFISSNAGKVQEAGKVILDAIANGIEENIDAIRGALEGITGAINSWVEGSSNIKALAGNFSDILINSLVENIKSKATSKFSELGTAFWNIFKDALKPKDGLPYWDLGNLFDGMWEKINPKAFAGGEDVTKNVVDGTAQGMSKYGYKFLETGNEAGKQVGNGTVEGAKEGIAPLTEVMALNEATTMLQQSATNMYNGAKVSFSQLGTVAKESMTNMYLGVQTSMNAATLSVKQSATDMYLGASTSFVGLRDAITTQFISISNVVSTQITNARNIMTSQMLSMAAVARTQSSAIRDGITTQFISINSVVRTQTAEARNTFTSQMLSMSAVCRTQASSIRNTITSQFISINAVIRTQIAEARNAFTSQMMSMSAVARAQSSSILSTFRSCAGQMRSIGVQIGSGLRNGLASQSGSIMATANSIANSVASTMRKALDIHSPSRVTREIGKYTIEGLGVGMNKEIPTLDKDIKANMESMVSRMKATVDVERAKVSANIASNLVSRSVDSNSDNGVICILESIKSSIDNIDPSMNVDGKELAIAITPHVSKELMRRRR